MDHQLWPAEGKIAGCRLQSCWRSCWRCDTSKTCAPRLPHKGIKKSLFLQISTLISDVIYSFIRKYEIIRQIVSGHCMYLKWKVNNVNKSIFFLRLERWFWPRRLACAKRALCVVWPLLLPSFSLFFFLLLFFLSPSFAFHTLRGISCVWKFVSPQYFGITRRYMHKKYVFR